MTVRALWSGFFLLYAAMWLVAQQVPFSILLEPITISHLPGVQSYAFGQANGKWLIVGGRLDGLHRRQPWATFHLEGFNRQLIVIDPETRQFWTASLNSLPVAVQEQLSSTNMEFYQEGEYLYCIGGYGYSTEVGDHFTFPYLTSLKVPDVIDAIINGEDFSPYVQQITDSLLQVAGGRLRKIGEHYYLLGGQKFIGRYNPRGPDHGPGFVQEYTNAIRVFAIDQIGGSISVRHIASYVDTANLHRRDYNAEAQILPDGSEGIVMFSGVFQHDQDLPFLNCVEVDRSGYRVVPDFKQYYNHYHCPTLPVYDAVNKAMYTVFFGGIAQYYDSAGVLIRDDDVPFVETIAVVARDSVGRFREQKLSVQMPGLLGAGAEFIPNLHLPHYSNGVLKLEVLPDTPVVVGYIYGGIRSSARNIFWINDGTQSQATNEIFRVYLVKSSVSNVGTEGDHSLGLSVYPNPVRHTLSVQLNLPVPASVQLQLVDVFGAVRWKQTFTKLPNGIQSVGFDVPESLPNGTYFLVLDVNGKNRLVQRIAVCR